jgi:F0F1-type ATP synthase gamma subunit
MINSIKGLAENILENEVLQSISSIYEITSIQKVDNTKDYILKAQQFFIDIRELYTVLSKARNLNNEDRNKIDKTVCLVMTSSGSFSGAADDEIIRMINEDSELKNSDIIIVGQRGVAKIELTGRKYILAFESPDISKPIDVSPLVYEIEKYKKSFVVYQEYKNLIVQDIIKLNLDPNDALADSRDQVIDLSTYILEPNYSEIMDYIESSILSITITQIIYESRLSEFANRFKTSQIINQKVNSKLDSLKLGYNQAKRRIRDERLREQIFQGGLNR